MGRGAAARSEMLKGGASKLKKTKGPKPSEAAEMDAIDKIAIAFMKADMGESGALDPQEFSDLLLSLHLGYRREYVERIFRKIDVNNDRQLSFTELKVVMINATIKNPDLPVGEIMQLVLSSMLSKKPLGQELIAGDYELKAPKAAPKPAAMVRPTGLASWQQQPGGYGGGGLRPAMGGLRPTIDAVQPKMGATWGPRPGGWPRV